jgi:hypothetical protein
MAGRAKPVIRFASVGFSACTDCHRDPHRGAMRQTCQSCHVTEGWNLLVNRTRFEAAFDHGATRFSLKGAHLRAGCEKCHNPRVAPGWTVRLAFQPDASRALYPAPRAANCQSCHVDVHLGVFARTAGGPACQNCHTETVWAPATYDFVRHSRETYPLTGAHIAVPCAGCHPTAPRARVPRFHLEAKECVSCHAQSDPHQGQFPARACSDCHQTAAFRVTTFDHTKTRYPLDGAHQKVACAGCHPRANGPSGAFVRYRPLETTCRACHGSVIPKAS